MAPLIGPVQANNDVQNNIVAKGSLNLKVYGLHLLVMFMCSSCCFHVYLCLLVVFLYFLVVWFFVMFDFCLLFIIVIILKAHEIQIKAKVEKRKRKIYDMFISLFLFYVYWKKKIVCLLVGILVPPNFLKNHASFYYLKHCP